MLRGITARFFSIRFSLTYYVNHLRSRLYRWNSVLYYVLIFLDVRMQHSKRKRSAAVLSFFRWRRYVPTRFADLLILLSLLRPLNNTLLNLSRNRYAKKRKPKITFYEIGHQQLLRCCIFFLLFFSFSFHIISSWMPWDFLLKKERSSQHGATIRLAITSTLKVIIDNSLYFIYLQVS